MTGMRPCACSTAMRIRSLCSSKSTVGDSPVVPTTTMPSVPSATCQSMSLRKRWRSRLPSSSIGVMMATRLPVIMGAILNLLRDIDRADALRHRRLGPLHFSFLEAEDPQRRKSLRQLPRLEEESRIRRPAEPFVPDHERLVDQHAALCQGLLNESEQGAMQVIGNDDRAEALTGERPRALLQVGLHELDAGNLLRLAIHGDDVEAAPGEEARVAAAAARDVEHRAARDHRRPTCHPLRG